MATWWYSLVGEADEAHAWDGGALPEETDYTRASFLNQFVIRMENRRGIQERMASIGFASVAVSAGSNMITAHAGHAGGFIKSFIGATNSLAIVVSSGVMPEIGDSSSVTISNGATLCASELSVLSALAEGDDFWSSEIFEAMYSILEKTKCFAYGVYSMTCDRYRVRTYDDTDPPTAHEYQGDVFIGYTRYERGGNYYATCVESDAVKAISRSSNVAAKLDYELFQYGGLYQAAMVYECKRPMTQGILYSTGAAGGAVDGATINAGSGLTITIGDIVEHPNYTGETYDPISGNYVDMGYSMYFFFAAYSRDDLL
jgi:hypothetical protein